MLRKFYQKKLEADYISPDLLTFDWSLVKKLGISLLFFDIDNTLAKHGSVSPDAYAREVVQRLKSYNFKLCILSNAKSQRGQKYSEELGIDYLGNARKPSPKAIIKKLQQYGLEAQQSLLVGDQLFTDIWAGKNSGCPTLLVKQRFPEEVFYVKLKRIFERFLIKLYGNTSTRAIILDES